MVGIRFDVKFADDDMGEFGTLATGLFREEARLKLPAVNFDERWFTGIDGIHKFVEWFSSMRNFFSTSQTRLE